MFDVLGRKLSVVLMTTTLVAQPCLANAADPIESLTKFGNSLFGGASDSSKKDDPPVANTGKQGESGLGKILGTAAGAGLGAWLGSKIGGGSGKTLATVGGGLIGAWVGSEIFSYLSKNDQNALAQSTERAVVTGKNQAWKNPDTGVQAEVKVVGEEQRVQEVSIPVAQNSMSKLPPLIFIGQNYQVQKSVNVRNGPGTNYRKVGSLAQGQVVHVIGQVENDQWMMIKQGEAASGFVHSSFLSPSEAKVVSAPSAIASAPPSQVSGAQTKTVSVKQSCRKIEQTITLKDGTTKTETVTACRGPNGITVLEG